MRDRTPLRRYVPGMRKAGWYLQESKKFGSRYYTEVSVERTNSQIRNPASFPVSYYELRRTAVLLPNVNEYVKELQGKGTRKEQKLRTAYTINNSLYSSSTS